MTDIIPLPESDFAAFVDIVANAYPGMKLDTAEARERIQQRLLALHTEDPITTVYGAYREGKLLGGMVFYDFTMQFYQAQVPVGAVGQIAVDLLHKKQKVARDMMAFFLAHYDRQGACLALLYPFRPDFYRQMGFGYGAQMHQYRVKPGVLPRREPRAHLRTLGPEDRAAVQDCYDRAMRRTHGMVSRRPGEIEGLFRLPGGVVGYEGDDSALEGYLAFGFERRPDGHFLDNILIVREMVYLHRAALDEFLAFLHTQYDQVPEIVFNTPDEHFYHLLSDPRLAGGTILPSVYYESNRSGVGLMYRVLNVPRLFEALAEHDFGGGTLRLKITLLDSFYPPNTGSTVVHFAAGRAAIAPEASAEVEIMLDVAEFSSLVTGVVPFERLHDYGLAEISNTEYLSAVDRLFRSEAKPVCLTAF